MPHLLLDAVLNNSWQSMSQGYRFQLVDVLRNILMSLIHSWILYAKVFHVSTC